MRKEYDEYLIYLIERITPRLKSVFPDLVAACYKCNNKKKKNNGECIKCGTIDQGYAKAYEELERLLDPVDHFIKKIKCNSVFHNKLFDYLYLLKKFDISCVNKLLDETNYEIIFKKYQDNLEFRMSDFSLLSPEECELVSKIFKTGNYNKDNVWDYINYINYNIFTKHWDFDRKTFALSLKAMTKALMKKYTKDPKFELANIPAKDGLIVFGEALPNLIRLNADYVQDCYTAGDSKVIQTIFHELRHVQKMNDWRNKEVVEKDTRMIKEDIIMGVFKDFYDENYEIISFEKDAEMRGLINYVRYLNSIGLESSNLRLVKSKIKAEIMKYNNDFRTYNGSLVSIDEMFQMAIEKTPKEVLKYPQLAYRFKYQDGKLIPKSESALRFETNLIVNGIGFSKKERNYYKLVREQMMKGDLKIVKISDMFQEAKNHIR